MNWRNTKKWILENINDSDFHVLLKVDGQYSAYLNLVEVEIYDDLQNKYKALGLGNVCSKYKGKGHGRDLMTLINKFFKDKNKIAILLCRNELINFYNEFDYKVYNELEEGVYLMGYNCNIDKIYYKGRPF